jgi:hypothetical protein
LLPWTILVAFGKAIALAHCGAVICGARSRLIVSAYAQCNCASSIAAENAWTIPLVAHPVRRLVMATGVCAQDSMLAMFLLASWGNLQIVDIQPDLDRHN